MLKLSILAALVASASAAVGAEQRPVSTDKFVLNKLPAKNITFAKDFAKSKSSFNKTELGKLKVDLLPNITALKGAKKEFIADKLNELTKDIDVMEHLSKEEVLVKPNKTAIIAKLDKFKDAVAAQINATIHKKDYHKEEPVGEPV